jgi:hypothetical protein
MALFAGSLCVFAVTRLVKLESFPIYFFTDEAIHTVRAAEFVHNGCKDSTGQFFPTYFQQDAFFPLSVSVYAQVIPYMLFGYSVFVTRATSVLIALSGMAAVGLILRDFVKIRFWWAGILLLAITPAWFLHSRTAFQTAEAVAFYAWFLYFYMRYRYGDRRWLFLALLFGALTFYTYTAVQMVVVVTGALLLLTDIRYHLRDWRIGALGVLFLILLIVPYMRFRLGHPGSVTEHLRMLDSYWIHDISLSQKLHRFWDEYILGLSPRYWYDPDNSRDLVRHQMKGYGNILVYTLPFAAIGLAVCLWKIRSSAHRTILIATVAAPVGGALAAVGVTRVLVFVIPAALFTAIGLAAVLALLTRVVRYRLLAVALFAGLTFGSVFMLYDALANGPTWYQDYGLYGMQYGARQVFGEVRRYLDSSPDTKVVVSPSWSNGTETLMFFFLPDEPRVRLANIDLYAFHKQDDLDERTLFVMTPNEYQRTLGDHKFVDIRVERTLKYPNGKDGFYFVRLRYAPDVDAMFAAEAEERRRPVQEEVTINGETVTMLHSRFDMGQASNLFDGDVHTLVRTAEANPAIIDLIFPQPRPLSGVTVSTGSMNLALTVRLSDARDTELAAYSQTYSDLPLDPTVDLAFAGAPIMAKKIHIEIRNVNAGEPANVHIREIVLR